MTDTAILEWKCLMKDFYKLDMEDVEGIARTMSKLHEQEDYMESKGFTMGINKVITPQGRVIHADT